MAENFNIILFDKFETLDALGPAEIMGRVPNGLYHVGCFSREGGVVASHQNVAVDTRPFSELEPNGIVLIPGGFGVYEFSEDADFIARLDAIVRQAKFVLTVCNGTAFLAKTDFLNGRKATTNKMLFDKVSAINNQVDWMKCARWVVDGNVYTSSGVSAGMDMALGFIADQQGLETAEWVAAFIEYIWNRNKDDDPFAAS